jgi:hypothetical protein
MKKITLLLTALFVFSLSYGQMKYLPTKTIVVILGAQNPHIDYSKFSDIEFYFTPELDNLYKDPETLAEASGLKAGMKVFKKNTATAKQEEVLNAYNGPNDVIFKRGLSKRSYVFDKNGIVYGKFWGENPTFYGNENYLIKNKSQDSEDFKTLLKGLVKKGETRKPGKNKKGKDYSWQPGYNPTSITVLDKDGNSKDLVELVKGNPATLLYWVHVNSKFDPKPGMESATEKDPEEYNNAVARTMTLDRQMRPLYDIEENIYGKKLKTYL